MQRTLAPLGLILTLGALACAQETTGERVVVPVRNSTRPRVVNAKVTYASITVKAYNGREVIVETPRSGTRQPETYQGLRRIDIPREGLEVTEEDNVIRVRTEAHGGNLVISVPADTSLQLSAVHGSVTVEGVHGDIDASTVHSNINLTNVSGNVIANSTHGNIRVNMDTVDPSKPLSFVTVHGDIEVTLPSSVKLNVKASTVQGAVYSDFEIRMGGNPNVSGGLVRINPGSAITGTINGGGADAAFRTVHGKILLRKK
jgi:hypothetical protein